MAEQKRGRSEGVLMGWDEQQRQRLEDTVSRVG
jgi:hypothetical protein